MSYLETQAVLNLNRKLIIPFTVVILFMVAGMAAYVFYWQAEEGRGIAARKLGTALSKLNSDFSRIQMANRDFANKLSRDSNLVEALTKEDRAGISSLFKNASNGRAFSGVLTAYDENGKVVYSSDTPAKFGYVLRGKNNAIDYVLNNQDNFIGPSFGLTAAQSIALSAVEPILGSNGQCIGLIAVSEPIDEEFLTGEAMKFALLSEPLSGIDLVLLNARDRGQIYCTPGLLRERPAYVKTLSEQSVKALPNWQEPGSGQMGNMFGWLNNLFNKNANLPELAAGFVKDNRFWQPYSLLTAASKTGARSLTNSNNTTEVVGIILASTPLFSQGIKPGYVILATCIMALAAIFSVVALSTQLANQPDGSVLALIERVKRWHADKHMPPGNKLTGALGELSELIDQTLIDWQSTIQELKAKLYKASSQTAAEKPEQQNQINDEQFEALNRQLANQSRQLSEFSRQLNHANQQAVFLQHELETILQSTTEGILILDQYGNIIHANNIFSNWLGTSEGGIAGRFCLDLITRSNGDGDNNQSLSSVLPFVKHEGSASALMEGFFTEGIIHHAQSNKAVEIAMNLQPVTSHDNRVNGYILVARDKSLRSEITGLKMEIVTMLARAIRGPLMGAEKEWQNILSNQSQIGQEILNSDPIPQLTDAPEEVHIQLNRELNQELRPPELTFVQRLASLHSRYNSLIASVESMLTTHGESIGQLIPLAGENAAFDSSDIESLWGTADPIKESFALSKLVGECLQTAANLASEKQLLLDYKTSTALPNITADRIFTKSILSPIIEKMISITAAGGKVRVESSTNGKEIQLSVASSGPALSEEETADIFAGFNPEKHDEESYSSRLALYLSRNNAERIGAKVWAQSETRTETNAQDEQIASQGTTVYIVFAVA